MFSGWYQIFIMWKLYFNMSTLNDLFVCFYLCDVIQLTGEGGPHTKIKDFFVRQLKMINSVKDNMHKL